jgi:hypothetical protein
VRFAALDGQLQHADRLEYKRVGEAVSDEAAPAEVVVHGHDAREAAAPRQGPDQYVAFSQRHAVAERESDTADALVRGAKVESPLLDGEPCRNARVTVTRRVEEGSWRDGLQGGGRRSGRKRRGAGVRARSGCGGVGCGGAGEGGGAGCRGWYGLGLDAQSMKTLARWIPGWDSTTPRCPLLSKPAALSQSLVFSPLWGVASSVVLFDTGVQNRATDS